MCIRDSYEVYETDSHVNLVLELMKGGHILEKVSQKGFYTEADASILMGKLLGALDHLHSRNIVHRDIKLDNLILIDSNDDTNVKIADFGLACKMNSEFYARRCGTPGYTAPEILNKKPYDTKVDIFSAGVVLFIMLVGYLPFEASTCSELLKKNQECDIDLSFPDEKTRPSDSAIDLLRNMLEKDPTKRYTAKQVLEHPWIITKAKDAPYRVGKSLRSAQENMKKFLDENRFNVSRIKPMGGMGFQSPGLNSSSPLPFGFQSPSINQSQLNKASPKKLDDAPSDAKLVIESDDDEDDEEMEDLSNIEEPSPLDQVISKLNRSSLIRKPSKETNSLSRISNSNSTNSSAINSPAPNVIYSPPLFTRAPYNLSLIHI
eukprot:TRINITY_DN5061_c0_g1_i9.p1 TRINITY_DN5061_c0_g1~~TRINITY_DN5061_c0_g1_i9.p1  ORF type:complete len:396 (-),score=122.35 TRINITY_DN5061_c0_g1_i9:62-1189(-)